MAAGLVHSQHRAKLALFTANMKARRLELKLIPRLAAAGAKMDRANWLRLEKGQAANIGMTTAFRVAEALNTTVGKLLGE